MKTHVPVAVFLLCVPLAAQDAPPAVAFERNTLVPMRDGVKLACDIWRPAAGRVPAILQRTPYGTDHPGMERENDALVQMGYAMVTVDCRGKFDSEGEWYPLRHEGLDGYDCIEWIAAQPWCDGHVGMLGGSYDAWVQLLAAAEAPPHLTALLPQSTPPDPVHNFPWQDGAFLAPAVFWARMTAGHGMNRFPELAGTWNTIYAHRPLLEMDDASGQDIAWFDDWVRHPLDDDYWRALSYEHRYGEMDVPALHMTGWYDDDQTGALRNFTGLRRGASSERARRGQRLLIGPWGHALNHPERLGGEVDFGPDATLDTSSLVLRWFDRWLQGRENGVDADKPVRLFIMGPNVWRDEDDWPLPRTRWTPYYFHAGGGMSTERPDDAAPSRFTYDPTDPTPYITGESSAQVGGPDDYAEIQRTRKDLLVFETEPLAAPLEATGPLGVVLYAATSAPDTDWTAMVCDVRPDGRSIRLNDGVIRAQFADSLATPTPVVPGQPRAYRIDCWATGCVFGRGHRIRVAIASSAFPKFHPNPNTGSLDPDDATWVKAEQRVFHDAEHPSHLLLPVIPGG